MKGRLKGRGAIHGILMALAAAGAPGQSFVREVSAIPVLHGSVPIADPFTGGMNAPMQHFFDIDADGDLDLFVFDSDFYPVFDFYRNDGDSLSADYRYSIVNPLSHLPVHFWFLFVDFDSDGLTDAALDDGGTGIVIWRNEGPPSEPVFTMADTLTDTAGVSIFAGFSSLPGFTDIDADGLTDFFSSNSADGSFNYYKNVGLPGAPAYALVTSSFGGITIIGDTCVSSSGRAPSGSTPSGRSDPQHGSAAMAFADLEGDGTADLFSGDIFSNGLFQIRNSGTPTAPMMECQTGFYPPAGGLQTPGFNQPSFADIDADGDLDLFVGVLNSRDRRSFWHYENAGSPFVPDFQFRTADYLSMLDMGLNVHPAAANLDGDADIDLVVGGIDGRLWLLRNDGNPATPVFTLADSNWAGIGGDFAYAPVFADLDADGDSDLILGRFDGRIIVYRNEGSAFIPADTIVQGQFATPAAADIDADGDADLIAGKSDGRLNFYRNVGDSTAFEFVLDSANYLGIDVGGFSRPAFALNRKSGLQELYVTPADVPGEKGSRIWHFRNAGTAQAPVFEFVTDEFGPLMPYEPALAFADIDADGDDDLFVGTSKGGLHFYRRAAPVAVGDDPYLRAGRPGRPRQTIVARNFPNPFNGGTTIRFELPRSGPIRIDIYSVDGRLLDGLWPADFAEKLYPAGVHEAAWRPSDLPSGIYVYRISMQELIFQGKMLYIK